MPSLDGMAEYQIALLIFVVRIFDVSLGTLRTISVVQGRVSLSVVLGFFEVIIWITALSQVVGGVSNKPYLMVSYALGYAAGNAIGIILDRKLLLGSVVVRLISQHAENEITDAFRVAGHRATKFQGLDQDRPVTLIYIACKRRDLAKLLSLARKSEPDIFYAVEPLQEQSEQPVVVFPHMTGWRARMKFK